MIRNLVKISISILFIFSCANRGNPSGGEIDVDPPKIVKSFPQNFSTNFNSESIEIVFDEFIKMRKLENELIISPPIDPIPQISPVGSANKVLSITNIDSLLENTTYSFNFGESIEDNNEGNILSDFRYVFSTGKFIDSLYIRGNISDAYDREINENINILLFEIDSAFSDSIIYKSKPKYVAKVVDSTSSYKLENLKAGNYLIIALEEENKDYIFQPDSDKIGFHHSYLELPKDTVINLKVFKEKVTYKISRPRQSSLNSYIIGNEGSENLKIKLLEAKQNEIESRITKDIKSDSLIYWFKTNNEIDSIKLAISNEFVSDTFNLKIFKKKKDSLVIKPNPTNVIKFYEDFSLLINTPINSIDRNKIQIINKDSSATDYTIKLDSINNKIDFLFEKTQNENYILNFLPGSIEDIFENQNDSLSFKLKTKTFDDYGNLFLKIIGKNSAKIIQLVNSDDKIKFEKITDFENELGFENIDPGKYYIRIIFDDNNNGKYDSGNFLNRTMPEKVTYFPDLIDIRAGWDLVQEYILNE
tara:strand:- start:961 stop:2556 length:1596 start_codon:yes stop_codon:yes gene_type:complete